MDRFLKKTALLFLFLVLIMTIIVVGWVALNYQTIEMPAPNLSNSYSFNEKMLFLKSKKKAEVMAIGSSISLNNVHSGRIAGFFHTDNYLNTASWGINMYENLQLLHMLYQKYEPSTVILVCDMFDFNKSEKTIRFKLVNRYINSSEISIPLIYLKTFRTNYYLENAAYARKVRNATTEYDYLGYDQFGGVNLKAEGFNIDSLRWNGKSLKFHNPDEEQYHYFDKIAEFCKSGNIRFLVFQNIYRKEYLDKLNDNQQNSFEKHANRIEDILEKYDFKLIRTDKNEWPDSLFVDSNHLNEIGAREFTGFCLSSL